MKNVFAAARYWVAGSCAALVGIVLARVAAAHVAEGGRVWLTAGGECLALVGLLVICVGVSRRVARSTESDRR